MTIAKKKINSTADVTKLKPLQAKATASKPREDKPVVPETGAAQEAAKVKHKLVRDSFTIPKSEYAELHALKLRTATLGRPAKKSEVLRAGIQALAGMSDKALLAALAAVPALKTGRPKGT